MYDLYSILALNCGLNTEYIKYDMSEKEIDFMLKRNFENYKNEWEQTRMIASSMVGKVSLPWDNEDIVVDNETKESKQERLQYLIDAVNKNNDINNG